MTEVKHTVDFHVQSHWARFNAFAWGYFNIAETAYVKFLEARKKTKPRPADEDPTEYFENTSIVCESSFQTIVFSAMACEAAVFDLAAVQLGDDYASNYLDKLDLVSKWIVVPSLICGRSLKIHGPAINSLRSLTKARNALVHHKSLPGDCGIEPLRRADQQMAKIVGATDEAFKTVVLLSLELNRILSTRSGVLPFFESGVVSFPEPDRAASVSEVIARCREIDAKGEIGTDNDFSVRSDKSNGLTLG